MTKNDRLDGILETLQQVAVELSVLDGATWQVEPNANWQARIKNATNDEALFVSFGYKDPIQRCEVSGSYPDKYHVYSRYKPANASASVSATRAPVAIARDIYRRVVPTYREQMAELQTTLEADERYNVAQAALLNRMAAAFRYGPSKIELENGKFDFWRRAGSGYGERVAVSVRTSQQEVELDIEHIPAALGEEVLRFLADKLGRT